MKHLVKITYCHLFLLLISCNFIPCEKVTNKDVAGYYVPCNSENRDKQYLKILENNTFVMICCNGSGIIENRGTWQKSKGCYIMLDPNKNSEIQGVPPYWGAFIWVRGKLAMGDEASSFQKTWRKPKLFCEK